MKKSTMAALGCGAGALACIGMAVHFWKRKQTKGAMACGVLGGCTAAVAAGTVLFSARKKEVPLLEYQGAPLLTKLGGSADEQESFGHGNIDSPWLQVGQKVEDAEYVGEMETSHFISPEGVNPSETPESNQMAGKGRESFGKYGGSSITNRHLNGRKVIIGISTSDSFQGKIVGEHAFIMCINEDNPAKSVMLDASGHYGAGRTSDIINGYQMKITIESYLKYWDTDEKLTTFKLRLTEPEECKIRNAILEMEGRSILSCASKASEILNKNYSVEIEECKTPRGLLRTLTKFAEKYPGKVTVRHFDLKTDKEIFGAKQ